MERCEYHSKLAIQLQQGLECLEQDSVALLYPSRSVWQIS